MLDVYDHTEFWSGILLFEWFACFPSLLDAIHKQRLP